MKDIFISLLHSYQYIPKSSKIKLYNNSYLTDSKGRCILGLENVPKDTEIYKVELENIKLKKKSFTRNSCLKKTHLDNIAIDTNLKVIIKVNTSILQKKINKGEKIPFRIGLFKLLRRNQKNLICDIEFNNKILNIYHYKNINQLSKKIINFNLSLMSFQLDNILWILQREKESSNINFLRYGSIKFGNIYLDLNLERFYLNSSSLQQHIDILGGILIEDPVCFTHISMISHISNDKRQTNFQINNEGLMEIKTTIILCQHNQCDKWKHILEKYSNLSFIIIQNKTHLEKYKYQHIASTDILILSLNCLSNTSYLNLWKDYISNGQNINQAYETIISEKIKNVNILNEKNVFFQLFYWRRIIFDNCVETLYGKTNHKLKEMVLLLKSKFRWIIEEPFTDTSHLIDIYSILLGKHNITDFNNNILSSLSSLTRKNDISHGLNKYIVNKNFHINFNLLESKYYNDLKKSGSEVDLKLFCSLSENKINIQEIYYNQLPEFINKITNNRVTNKIFIEKVNTYNKELLEETCSICLNNINISNIGFTNCLHLYCFTCIHKCIQKNEKCPQCRTLLKDTNIFKLIKNSINHNNLSISLGSKLNSLIKYISNINYPIIILSSYGESINKLALHFNKLNFKFIAPNSLNQINKSITKFNKLNYQFLLLSNAMLKNIDHIDKVKEVILLDPIYENKNSLISCILSKLYTNNVFYKIKFINFLVNNTIETN